MRQSMEGEENIVSKDSLDGRFNRFVEYQIRKRDLFMRASDDAAVEDIDAELKSYGVVLEDAPQGVRWEYTR